MKTQFYKLFIFSLFVIALGSCKKDTEMPTGEFVNLETHEAGTITAISAVVDAKAKASCTGRGVCWGKAPNPTLDDFHIANGSGKGEYSCSLTELEPNQKYYYRAYATDGERIAYALDEKSFTTKDGIVHLTTGYVTDITATSATCSGNIADDGGCPITERGFCWSTTPNPTLENNDLHIAAGSGTGEFSVALADLTPDATYYVRAYAISILGTTYADDEKDFVTRDGIPVVATSDICDITATSATCGGNITADGNCPVIERGICFGTSPNPTLENNAPHETLGDGIGEFSTTLTDLTPDMTYYVRAYAINSLGTTYAQDEKSFTTKDGIPVLITHDVSDITATSAKCSGNITDDGGFAVTERGFCWSTHPEPTLENNDPHIAAGSGTGEFSATLNGLEESTTYHVCAYATNVLGTRYGNEKTFTTKDGVAKVTTGNVADITATSAKCSGNVTDDGGFAVTERGICWSRNPNPTLENAQHVAAGSGTGKFSATLNGLEESTTYHVQAYAVNSNGTQYGEDVSFTLTPPLTFTAGGVTFKMIFVEGGTFTMGATAEQGSDAYDDEKPTHSVTLSSYHMGETEVTQALWKAVMGSNPSYYSGSNLPVEKVSWNDCQEFITKLNQLCASQLNGRQFRLPTEAEWEYAARGGKQSRGYKYSGSNTLGDVAWYGNNSSSTTHTVGTKQANELGLYDMSGNVYEWCQDWYDSSYYSISPQNNPTGPAEGSDRVFRGGSWFYYNARYHRVSYRCFNAPGYTSSILGLRLSLR